LTDSTTIQALWLEHTAEHETTLYQEQPDPLQSSTIEAIYKIECACGWENRRLFAKTTAMEKYFLVSAEVDSASWAGRTTHRHHFKTFMERTIGCPFGESSAPVLLLSERASVSS